NDATESFDPEKDAIDTLNDELNEFSDENIDTTTKKMVIAINLGVLSNFLDSKYKSRYTKLAEFVKQHKILDMEIKYYTFDHTSPFQFVNFSDYHLYYLTENGAKSSYISELVKKITNQVPENPFNQAYQTKCRKCPVGKACPIKLNYELLSNDTVVERMTQKIIEVIVKDKLIISTRALLNFIYDVLVHHELAYYSEYELKKFANDVNIKQLIEYLLPTNLFAAKENSAILHSIALVDPLTEITEQLDELMVKINITDNLTKLIDEYIDVQAYPMFKEIMLAFDEEKKNEEILLKLITTFMRLNFLLPAASAPEIVSQHHEFLRNLYLFNNPKPQTVFQQTELIKAVRQAIYDWNGKVRHGKMNILVGENQEQYICSQDIEITVELTTAQEIPEGSNELHKFLPNIVLNYGVTGMNNETMPLEIDYNLYRLLIQVLDGYRPNLTDKYNHIRFVDYVEQMSKRGNQSSEIYITDKNVEQQSAYNLKVERFGMQNVFTFKKI
ncbi:MAG: DNA phosphorothioation-dependent restriction protein DptF, partial [Culicoidibacterales bacterium]